MGRFYFYKRDRWSSETMKDYVASIRKLAMECEFAGKLDDNLKDRLVYRIND